MRVPTMVFSCKLTRQTLAIEHETVHKTRYGAEDEVL